MVPKICSVFRCRQGIPYWKATPYERGVRASLSHIEDARPLRNSVPGVRAGNGERYPRWTDDRVPFAGPVTARYLQQGSLGD